MSITVKVDVDNIKEMLRDLVEAGDVNVKRGMQRSTEGLLNSMRDTLNRQGSGERYLSGQSSSRYYRASRPGKPPATDTGTYRDSWRSRMDNQGFKGVVFTPDKRAKYFMKGTRHMAPRPHAKPVAKKHVKKHVEHMKEALRQAGREVT